MVIIPDWLRDNYPLTARGMDYLNDVLSGKIVAGKWVVLACARAAEDFDRVHVAGFHFDPSVAERVLQDISKMPHVKGIWAKRGETIRLGGWNCFILMNVFGWINGDGVRRFHYAYIEVPRKNAKSTITGALALVLLARDDEMGAEIYSAATTREQARIVFGIGQQMARKSPSFRRVCGVEVSAHAVTQPDTASRFVPLSADANTLDGLNTHAALIDELHAHKIRTVFDVLDTSTGSRTRSLIWMITTAGSNQAGICFEQRLYVTKILEGTIEDESYFGIIYTVDDDEAADVTRCLSDPALWEKANPNWGVSVMPDDIARKARKALELPAEQNSFLTKHLNIWVNADTSWMNMVAWNQCADTSLTFDRMAKDRCIVALDLASKIDFAAAAFLFERIVEGKSHYYLIPRFWIPEARVESDQQGHLQGWKRAGALIESDGSVIDFDLIEQFIEQHSELLNMIEVAYDPFQATQTAVHISGFQSVVEVGATVKNLSDPMKELEAAVIDGRFHHDGNPVMTWMISNVVCHRDAKDNIFPRKQTIANKIDGAVATIMALARFLAKRDPKRGAIYDRRGVISA